jgi:molybdenum cofactor cytidylyltransferase
MSQDIDEATPCIHPARMSEAWTFSAVILGAGRSSRMGRPKLLLPWGNTTVIGHLITQWTRLGAEQVAVVCQPDDAALHAELDRLKFPAAQRIPNPDPDRGMFSSLQCAASWDGLKPVVDSVALALGDQPHLSTETLSEIVAFAQRHPEKICQPARAGHGRHPVFLLFAIFREIANSTAGTLKQFLAGHSAKLELLEMDDPGLDLDLDRPEDYQRAMDLSRTGL